MKLPFDILILGGGASGLLCAVTAKSRHPERRVAVIEKNDRVGKKLLATGNGRCNLTHLGITADKYTGSLKPWAEKTFATRDAAFLRELFARLGLLTFADSEGRVYPLSRQASSVLDVLRFACERLGVEIFCGETPHSVRREGSGFAVKTAERAFLGGKLVLACGSKAAPKLGGSASGLDIARNFGLRTAAFQPALCPVYVNSGILRSLKGLRAAAEVSLHRDGRRLYAERGEVQFADGTLSGICVFDLSLFTRANDTIAVDLLPDISQKELYNILNKNLTLFAARNADDLLTGVLQKRLAQAVMKQGGAGDFSRRCRDLSEGQLRAVAETAKALCFPVTENSGFEQAQCTKGGVCASELSDTLESKRVKNLYICGEAADLCGMCGGYNLHFAFVSGRVVGEQL